MLYEVRHAAGRIRPSIAHLGLAQAAKLTNMHMTVPTAPTTVSYCSITSRLPESVNRVRTSWRPRSR